MAYQTTDQAAGRQGLQGADPARGEEAGSGLIRDAALLLEVQGHDQAAAVMRSATRLLPPSCEAGFSGRWTVWTDSAMLPAPRYEIAQQIKRALNAIYGIDVSYADLFATDG